MLDNHDGKIFADRAGREVITAVAAQSPITGFTSIFDKDTHAAGLTL
jgi:hypothetical protein